MLITREEGNSAYNFNLKFRYDGAAKSFDLTQILLDENNTECDQSLLNTHAVDREALAFTVLSDFDGTRAFGALELNTLVSYFMAGDEDGTCDPEGYIVEKYYFPQRVGWSNDLAFLFEQAGYYPEATALLKHVIQKHPDRVVAYLNLADAYWAQGKRAQAKGTYGQYYERMVAAQKQSRIPDRVMSRK